MIESGSLVPGVDAADFRLPVGTALRIERPAAALRPQLLGYSMLDSDPALWTGPTSWTLPGWARIWIPLTDAPITVRPRSRRPTTLDRAMMLGPISRGMPVTSHGGVSVMIDVGPAGWARWFGRAAHEWRDRAVPLVELWPAPRVNDLLERLHTLDRADAIKPLLDGFFRDHLPPPHEDEPMIERARAIVTAGQIIESAALAAALDLNPHALRRLFTHHFGFTPKRVMRRTRFLRALAELMLADARPDFADAPAGYHDVSHFLRDARDFLALTPRQFLALPIPYLRAIVRARRIVLGAPLALLDTVGSVQEASSCSSPRRRATDG